MANDYRRLGVGLLLETNSTASTIEGTLRFDTATNQFILNVDGGAEQIVSTSSNSLALTNKTLVVSSNTVTTAASGNLVATELNAALSELQTDIDTRATTTDLNNHMSDTTTHGTTGNVVGTSDTQTLTNKTVVVASNTITTAASGNLVATELNAALAELQTDIDTRATTSDLTTHMSDTTTHGTTGNIVGTSDIQTLTNKTVVVASNTITTAASGNLLATELNAALAELQTDIDTRALNSDLTTHMSDTTTHGTTGDIVGTSDTQTLTNKTINGSNNTITNVSLTTGVTGTLSIGNGGTGQTTANTALNALLPSQATHSGKVLQTDGTNTSWQTNSASLSIGGAVTSGTTGSILFVGSGPVLAQDNTNLFWDDTNNRLGIGTATPSQALDVVGIIKGSSNIIVGDGSAFVFGGSTTAYLSGSSTSNIVTAFTNSTERMRIDSSGNVGVGTSSIPSRLTIFGTGETTTISDVGNKQATIRVTAGGGSAGDGGAIEFGAGHGSYTQSYFSAIKGLLTSGSDNTKGSLNFYTRNATTDSSLTNRMTVDSDGNLLLNSSNARTNVSGTTPIFQLEGTTAGTSTGTFIRNTADTGGSIFRLSKSRGSTVGSNTTVAAEDNIGSVVFNANDGTNFIEAARIIAIVDGTPGTNDMPGRLEFRTTSDGESSSTERMRIDSQGRTGIGTTPSSYFHVAGTNSFPSTPVATFSGNNGGGSIQNLSGLSIYTNFSNGSTDTTLVYGNTTSSYLAFGHHNGTSYTERMRIDSNGKVGIGLAPTYTLDVLSNNVSIVNAVCNTSAAGSTYKIVRAQYNNDADCTNGRFFSCINSSGTEIGAGFAATNTTITWSASSDTRLKTNPTSFNGLELVNQIKPKEFEWISNPGIRHKGFYAQELYEVLPEVVGVGSDDLTEDGSLKQPWSIDYGKLTPVLVKAIQELSAQNAALLARIEALENV